MTALAVAGAGGWPAPPDPMFARDPEAIWFEQMHEPGIKAIDRVPCTRCHLRGHVAGDPERCLYYRGSFGLGGTAAAAQEQSQWQLSRRR